MRCRIGDGGRPSGAALQGEAPNHRRLLWSRAMVGSVAEKAHRRVRQVRARKASASKPLMKCRKRSDGVKTGVLLLPRDESGGNLPTAQAVPGMKVARAWLRLRCGTWEPVAPLPALTGWVVPGRCREGEPRAEETARGRVPMRGTGADRSVVAMNPGNAGGAKGAGCPGFLGGQPKRRIVVSAQPIPV